MYVNNQHNKSIKSKFYNAKKSKFNIRLKRYFKDSRLR